MGRLARFEDYRFVGTRDTMRVYDCDDSEQLRQLQRRIEAHGLDRKNLLQAFAPDSVAEAANRGFEPVA